MQGERKGGLFRKRTLSNGYIKLQIAEGYSGGEMQKQVKIEL